MFEGRGGPPFTNQDPTLGQKVDQPLRNKRFLEVTEGHQDPGWLMNLPHLGREWTKDLAPFVAAMPLVPASCYIAARPGAS